MVFVDMWSLFGGYFVLFCQESVIEVGLFLQDGCYSEMALTTSFTVYNNYITIYTQYTVCNISSTILFLV